jgi:hypothetical protein
VPRTDAPISHLERRLLIEEARKFLKPIDPSHGVGHAGMDSAAAESLTTTIEGLGRAGGPSSSAETGNQARLLAERILAILGER